jgi:Gas vesicle protein K
VDVVTPVDADRLLAGSRRPGLFGDEMEALRAGLAGRVNADRENLEKGLAQLVMTVIELLRQLMERQALHRIEGGSLSDEEVERLGRTFMALAERMEELKTEFGLADEDLNLSLGPLGNLM